MPRKHSTDLRQSRGARTTHATPIPNAPAITTRLAGWVGLGLLTAFVFVLSDALAGRPFAPGHMLVLGLACAGFWLLFASALWRFVGRFPLLGRGAVVSLAIHLPASIAVALLCTGAFTLLMAVVELVVVGASSSIDLLFRTAAFYFLLSNVAYYAIVAVARTAFDFSHAMRRQELRAARAEQQLTAARLDVLRMQMNPHFLFNTLEAIAGLVRSGEDERALRMLANLGSALRAALDEGGLAFAPLESEVQSLDSYLDIERCRFGDRLDFDAEIDDDVAEVLVPRWILQPLVENAVVHGIESDPDAGTIRLRAMRGQERLRIEIDDDGRGAPERIDEGLGLGNARARLREIYGGGATLDVAQRDRGTRVTIEIPLEPGDSARPSNGDETNGATR